MLTLEETIELILKHRSDFERNDILTMIQEKRQELGPEVINDESAAMIVARELGVDLHKVAPSARQRIEDITESTKNVNALVGIIDNISAVRTFQKSDGTEGKVASVFLRDETGSIRVVLWDDMTRAISEDILTLGSIVQVRGAYVKMGLGDAIELNIGRMGTIQPLEDDEAEEMGIDFDARPVSEELKISGLQDRLFDVTMKVKVQRVFNLTTFTRKKDNSEGKVLSMIVADDTGKARLVFWDDRAEEMEDAQPDEIIRVTGAYTKSNREGNEIEIHAGNNAKIERKLKDQMRTVETPVGSSSSSVPLGMKNIGDLTTNMWDVDIEGKAVTIYDVRNFTKKDGSEGQVRNVVIADQTSKIRVTFWEDDVDKIAKVKEGDVIRILHGYTKEGFRGGLEFTVGRKAELVLNPKDSQLKQLDLSQVSFESVQTQASRVLIGDIDNGTVGKNVEICGIIVGIGQTGVIYQACPTCNKKLETTEDGYNCKSCGPVKNPEPRMLYKITVDDGSGSIKATLFGNIGEKLLGMTAEEAHKIITKSGKEDEPLRLTSDKILGRYVAMYGLVKEFRDSLDISINGFEFADPVQEIKRLKGAIQKEIS
ncbi:MAG: OB-fold nucleic acid binding domain-containing protein [Candidatus Odinarchaeota archaeon]|nr:OB-fold nucleic acid binding domain-containing protein [Candidatus Thorarchaeota archaeon]